MFDRCLQEEPELTEARPGWWARCFLAGEEAVVPLTRPAASAAGAEEGPSVEEGPSGWENDSHLELAEQALEAALEGDIERQAKESEKSVATGAAHDDDASNAQPDDEEPA